MPVDLKLKTISNGRFDIDDEFIIIDGLKSFHQAVFNVVNTKIGEYKYNINSGMDYDKLISVSEQDINIFYLNSFIYNGLDEIAEFSDFKELKYNVSNKTITISFSVLSTFGTVVEVPPFSIEI